MKEDADKEEQKRKLQEESVLVFLNKNSSAHIPDRKTKKPCIQSIMIKFKKCDVAIFFVGN